MCVLMVESEEREMLNKKVLEEKVARYNELKAQLEVLEAEQDKIKAELSAEMERRNVEELVVGNNTVRLTSYVQSRFDSGAFKKANPVEYENWVKRVCGHRFSVV